MLVLIHEDRPHLWLAAPLQESQGLEEVHQ
jgi:hypothetical protein